MEHRTPAKAIHEITERLTRLEKAVFGKKQKLTTPPREEKFTGPSGGIRLLISKNFFHTKRNLGDVRKELAKHDYHYSKQAVHEALKRLSGKGSSLVALAEGEKKLYVKRK